MKHFNYKLNKNILVFFFILIIEIYYFIRNKYIFSPSDLYFISMDLLYNTGILVLSMLLIISGIVSYFERDSITIRYSSIADLRKAIMKKLIISIASSVIFLNLFPLISSILRTNKISLVHISIYLIRQLGFFILVVYIYLIFLKLIKNRIATNIITFLTIYIPNVVIKSLRMDLLTPIDMVSIQNINYSQLVVQMNFYFILLILSIGIFDCKFKFINRGDFIRRKEDE